MEKSLHMAVRIAADFDKNPVFTFENVLFLNDSEKQNVYDDSGLSATDGLKIFLEDLDAFVSEAFLRKLDREIESVNRPASRE